MKYSGIARKLGRDRTETQPQAVEFVNINLDTLPFSPLKITSAFISCLYSEKLEFNPE